MSPSCLVCRFHALVSYQWLTFLVATGSGVDSATRQTPVGAHRATCRPRYALKRDPSRTTAAAITRETEIARLRTLSTLSIEIVALTVSCSPVCVRPVKSCYENGIRAQNASECRAPAITYQQSCHNSTSHKKIRLAVLPVQTTVCHGPGNQ